MNKHRRTSAWNKRNEANQLATDRPHPRHFSNGDEYRFRHRLDIEASRCHVEQHKEKLEKLGIEETLKLEGKPSFLMSFTKGMPHNYATGLVQTPLHFQYFLRAIDSGNPRDFRDTPLGPDEHLGVDGNCEAPQNEWKSEIARTGKLDGENGSPVSLRAWESQSAGLAFDLEGPDAQAVTMPPAPSLGSEELVGEMGEVYVQALLRDVPFRAFSAGVKKANASKFHTNNTELSRVGDLVQKLAKLKWFSNTDLKLNEKEEARQCKRLCPTAGNAFRGITKGDDVGPYISQFLLIGNKGLNGEDDARKPSDGLITYGAVNIDQRVRVAASRDYMQTWEEWFDVQNGAAVGNLEKLEGTAKDKDKRRFIYTPRDLATYVHYDALYQAYLNACLILLGNKVKFDPGIPFQDDDSRDHQQGFAHFGGPHILSLLTEVATRALKAVRFQKYNIHRRCRPEVLAARITKADHLAAMAPELVEMRTELDKGKNSILSQIASENKIWDKKNKKNYLLPMAFTEGSPMHPSYGAGHATVAGACVTILKAFFDCNSIFKPNGTDAKKAYVATDKGKSLKLVPVFNRDGEKVDLTVEGELNKLASNISIGRDWAGVHYFSDYYESILMGEQIAIAILEEQKLMFGENFSMTIPLFGGDTIRI